MSGFMFQSDHERNRSNATGSLVSTDLHDVPKSYDLHNGDVLIWREPANKTEVGRWISAPGPQFSTLINNNRLAIEDLSKNRIPTEITNLINGAPQAMDTLKEIADIIGDDTNIAGSIATRLTVHDNSINSINLTNIRTDASLNQFQTILDTHTNQVNTNTNNIATNLANQGATNTGYANSINANTNNIATNNTNITNHNNRITTNNNDIATNLANITTNTNNITTINTWKSDTQLWRDKTDASMNKVFTDTMNNNTLVLTNQTNIGNNSSTIAGNTTNVNTNITNIGDNLTKINQNTTNITNNDADINALDVRLDTIEQNNLVTINNNLSTHTTSLNLQDNRITNLETDVVGNGANPVPAVQTLTFNGTPDAVQYSIKINNATITFNGVAANTDATANTLNTQITNLNLANITNIINGSVITITGKNDGTEQINYQSNDIETTAQILEFTNENLQTTTNGKIETYSHKNRLNKLDVSMNLLETVTKPQQTTNTNNITTNTNNITTNTNNITTNTNDITTNTNDIATEKARMDTLMNGSVAALDTLKELSDALGDPTGIGSNIITKLGTNTTNITTNTNNTATNTTNIATNTTNISNNTTSILNKQNTIGVNGLEISHINGLQTAINSKANNTYPNLNISNVIGLQTALNGKNTAISNGDLSIAQVSGLQTKLDEKQSLIGNNTLPQSKINNLINDLANKQPIIGANDLQISYISDLQNQLNAKQNVLTDNSVTIQQVHTLQTLLDTKQPNLQAGTNINIGTNNVISSSAATILNELSDCKSNTTNFAKSILIGSTSTGTLVDASNNIGIGYNSLLSLTSGQNNVAIGSDSLNAVNASKNNVAIGFESLKNNQKEGNVGIGYNSGLNNIHGTYNTYVGYDSGPSIGQPSLINTVAIGNQAHVSSSNTIQLGNTNIVDVKSYGKLKLKNTATQREVEYTNTHNGIDNQYLVIDQNGSTSWKNLDDVDVATLTTTTNNHTTSITQNTTNITNLQTTINTLTGSETLTNVITSINTINDALDDGVNDGSAGSFYTQMTNLINDRISSSGNDVADGQITFTKKIIANAGIQGNCDTTTAFATQTSINNKPYYGQANISLGIEDILGTGKGGSGSIITDAERVKLALASLDTDNINVFNAGALMASKVPPSAGDPAVSKDQDVNGIKTFKDETKFENKITFDANNYIQYSAGIKLKSTEKVIIEGDLHVDGDIVTVNQTNMDIIDRTITLNNGVTNANSVDSGILINRGTDDSAAIFWDEDNDKFHMGTTTDSGTTITTGSLIADIEGNVTGNVSGTAASVTNASQTTITSVGTLTGLQIDDGGKIGSATDDDAIVIAANGEVTFSQTIQGNLSGSVTGNADTATSVSGAQIGITSVGTLSGLQISDGGKIGSVGDDDAIVIAVNGEVTFSQTIQGNLSGNVTGNITGDVTGNSGTTDKLKIAVDIAGKSFDGSSDITINAADLGDVTSVGSGDIITAAERTKWNTTDSRTQISSVFPTGNNGLAFDGATYPGDYTAMSTNSELLGHINALKLEVWKLSKIIEDLKNKYVLDNNSS